MLYFIVLDFDGFQCCGKIEIGEEFKIESSVIENTPDDDSKLSGKKFFHYL